MPDDFTRQWGTPNKNMPTGCHVLDGTTKINDTNSLESFITWNRSECGKGGKEVFLCSVPSQRSCSGAVFSLSISTAGKEFFKLIDLISYLFYYSNYGWNKVVVVVV